MAAVTSSWFETSHVPVNTGKPCSANSPAVFSRVPGSKSSSAIFDPDMAKRIAVALPIPLAPPVTTTILSLNGFFTRQILLIVLFLNRGGKGDQFFIHILNTIRVDICQILFRFFSYRGLPRRR